MKRSQQTTTETPFTIQLRELVARVILEQKRIGTVSMGRENLWQLVVGRIMRNCPHAPRGTNAAWVAKQDFDTVVASESFVN